MSRLYEEVRVRLEEMAMITSRTLKLNTLHDWTLRFQPLGHESGAVELLRTAQGAGCYDYRGGACFETTLDESGCG